MFVNQKMQDFITFHPHAMVGYLLAGYPDQEAFFRMAKKSVESGLSILEIGFPSNDPRADGEVIRKAHACVDKSICSDLSFWKKLRDTVEVPIWIMGYKKDLYVDNIHLNLAKSGLVDAFVIPDMGTEELFPLGEQLREYHTELVPVISSETPKAWLNRLLAEFPLIYQQLYSGPTGLPIENESYQELLAYNVTHEGKYLFAGFGIHSKERVEELLESGFYGVIIGTAIMKALNDSEDAACHFIEGLSGALLKVGKEVNSI